MESLLLFCRALSSPTMCRFSPALSVPEKGPSPKSAYPLEFPLSPEQFEKAHPNVVESWKPA
jgi:hypothetical protein